MDSILLIFNHSGSLLEKRTVKFPSVPRAGELIEIETELDNTSKFIVTDVTYLLSSNIATPQISCESFYAGEKSRLHYMKLYDWA
jgi:hypothetical protein